jgi:hypothetical protein
VLAAVTTSLTTLLGGSPAARGRGRRGPGLFAGTKRLRYVAAYPASVRGEGNRTARDHDTLASIRDGGSVSRSSPDAPAGRPLRARPWRYRRPPPLPEARLGAGVSTRVGLNLRRTQRPTAFGNVGARPPAAFSWCNKVSYRNGKRVGPAHAPPRQFKSAGQLKVHILFKPGGRRTATVDAELSRGHLRGLRQPAHRSWVACAARCRRRARGRARAVQAAGRSARERVRHSVARPGGPTREEAIPAGDRWSDLHRLGEPARRPLSLVCCGARRPGCGGDVPRLVHPDHRSAAPAPVGGT